MKSISKENVISFQQLLINRFGGLHGIKNESALDSALNIAFLTFDRKDLYKTTVDKITAISYSLIENHPFNDGNKRIGVLIMLMLLEINDIIIKYSQEELIELGLGIASGKLKQNEIKLWIEKHIIQKS